MLKKILISLGAVVLVTVATVGILYAVQQNTAIEVEPTDTQSNVSIDLSKDYQACTTISFDALQNALGATGDSLQEPQNAGITGEQRVGEGVDDVVADSQTCVYAFTGGGTVENGFNAGNAFVIQKTLYTNATGTSAVIAQTAQDPTLEVINGIGDAAFYSSSDQAEGPDATYVFDLLLFREKERISLTIRQPADEATFTAESARSALLSIAQEIIN